MTLFFLKLQSEYPVYILDQTSYYTIVFDIHKNTCVHCFQIVLFFLHTDTGLHYIRHI